ncbi:uncharacterized protein L201_001261 [Kwoniella dendrophila CBS 6074]|uniref:HpcH/HpaI aldolase/citrate lyase domain-containing protein n=1 Tax=Kwoniella dendrophila CBS 6074 TaxID=1295534 RepID=A0AAX4JPA4_9TREE
MESRTYLRNALQKKQPGLGFWCTTVYRLNRSGDGRIQLVTAAGASPIIRVPWNEEWMIKRALDAGAHGVMTPMCHTAADAQKIVQYSKYPPTGSRGYGPMFCPPMFGCKASEYDSQADDKLLVFVQIESPQGISNVEEIAKVPGLDVLFIAAHDAGKVAAIFCPNGQVAKKRLDQGFDMVSIAVDGACLAAEMERQMGFATGTTKTGDRSYS